MNMMMIAVMTMMRVMMIGRAMMILALRNMPMTEISARRPAPGQRTTGLYSRLRRPASRT
jgi:hypothetical protein